MSDLTQIGAVNIRVAHERIGCARTVVPYMRKEESIYNTLILAPPGMGKTTMLRDCIRILSSGEDGGERLKVSVVDERSEIAACVHGIPQNDLGPTADVLDNCPKRQGMRMLLRSMSPQVIAVYELGGREDFRIVREILYSGSRVIGTVHAAAPEDLWHREYARELTEEKLIGRMILLGKAMDGTRTVAIYDEEQRRLC